MANASVSSNGSCGSFGTMPDHSSISHRSLELLVELLKSLGSGFFAEMAATDLMKSILLTNPKIRISKSGLDFMQVP